MEIAYVKHLYKEGFIVSAKVSPVEEREGCWNLILTTANGEDLFLTKTRVRTPKVFKRINSALIDAKDIGFSKVDVDLANSSL